LPRICWHLEYCTSLKVNPYVLLNFGQTIKYVGRHRETAAAGADSEGMGPTRQPQDITSRKVRPSPLPSALTFPRAPRRLPPPLDLPSSPPRRRHGLQVRSPIGLSSLSVPFARRPAVVLHGDINQSTFPAPPPQLAAILPRTG
jgi:hypothetical protein